MLQSTVASSHRGHFSKQTYETDQLFFLCRNEVQKCFNNNVTIKKEREILIILSFSLMLETGASILGQVENVISPNYI